jgi:hypothetical protein
VAGEPGVRNGQIEREPRRRGRDVDGALGAVAPAFGVGVLEDGSSTRARLERALGDGHRRRRPPGLQQVRLDPVLPHDRRRHGQYTFEREGAAVGPPVPVGERGLRLDGGAVALEDVALTAVHRRQLPQPPREVRERRGLESVDAALSQRVDGDEARAGEGLQVLGCLRLTGAGQLGQFTDGAGPLGEQLDDAPPGGVPQR